MSSEAIQDAELVARSRRRDTDAFGALVERHQRLVFGVALARCQDAALAEDIAQEAFVTAWRDLDRLRDTERVGSWVAGIARNLAANAARDRARPRPELDAPAPVTTPEDEALAREDAELLRRALGEVPDAHRETLVLYYMEGQSIAAIAAALDINEDLVKQRLSRGRKALRDGITARVEGALARTRTSPAFRAGVVTAIAATGAREAQAAPAAGKVLTMLTMKKVAIAAAATAAVAGGALWLGSRANAGDHSQPSAVPATHGTTTNAPAPGASATVSAPPKVRKLANASQRAPLLASIREASRRRLATAPSPAPATSAPALPDGDLDKEYVRAAVHELIPLLTECYEQGLDRDSKLQGKVVVNFTIEGEPGVGAVVGESNVDAGESTLTDPGVRECIQETMYALEIDPPQNGGHIEVHYPFEFRSE